MNMPAPEELAQQILSTCLLINTQGEWHAFLSLSGHVGEMEVRLVPSDHDYQDMRYRCLTRKSVIYASTNRYPNPELTNEQARQRLSDLLAWTQGFLKIEASA